MMTDIDANPAKKDGLREPLELCKDLN